MQQGSNPQIGFAHVIVIVLVSVAVAGFIAWRVVSELSSHDNTGAASTSHVSSNKIVMKSIGFKLDYYNEATHKAGDMEFTKIPLAFDQIWSDFGQQDPRSPNNPTKRNPQPTYILPLGTKVESLVDGKVTKVETLYSGDSTIHVQPEGNDLTFETEHIDKPLVKVGDMVKSGQIIAEVSAHDSQHHPGFGILEIGVLGQSNNRPSHTCPYVYLDESIKDAMLRKIADVHTAWEAYLGKDVYGDTYALPGCVTMEPFVE